MERGRKGVHGLRVRHTPGSNLSLFTDHTHFEICCVFTALLQMIQVLWAVSIGKDISEALYATGQSTTMLALKVGTQCNVTAYRNAVSWQCERDSWPRNVSKFGDAVTLRACSMCCEYLAVASKGWYGYGLSRSGRHHRPLLCSSFHSWCFFLFWRVVRVCSAVRFLERFCNWYGVDWGKGHKIHRKAASVPMAFLNAVSSFEIFFIQSD